MTDLYDPSLIEAAIERCPTKDLRAVARGVAERYRQAFSTAHSLGKLLASIDTLAAGLVADHELPVSELGECRARAVLRFLASERAELLEWAGSLLLAAGRALGLGSVPLTAEGLERALSELARLGRTSPADTRSRRATVAGREPLTVRAFEGCGELEGELPCGHDPREIEKDTEGRAFCSACCVGLEPGWRAPGAKERAKGLEPASAPTESES